MELHLKIIGAIFVLLALIHLVFPKYFEWKSQLQSLSLVNQQLMYVHTFFVALMVLLIGVFCLYCSDEIVNTALGNKVSLGLFIFWGIRLYVQFFGYSSKLWKGKLFETTVHVLFSILWLYVTVVFFLVAKVWQGFL